MESKLNFPIYPNLKVFPTKNLTTFYKFQNVFNVSTLGVKLAKILWEKLHPWLRYLGKPLRSRFESLVILGLKWSVYIDSIR